MELNVVLKLSDYVSLWVISTDVILSRPILGTEDTLTSCNSAAKHGRVLPHDLGIVRWLGIVGVVVRFLGNPVSYRLSGIIVARASRKVLAVARHMRVAKVTLVSIVLCI